MMRRIILLFLFLGMSTPLAAATMDPALQELCNKTMTQVYKDILTAKSRYPELANFGEKSFSKNQQGVFMILYDNTSNSSTPKDSVSFGVTIEDMKSQTFSERNGITSFSFPALGVKFSTFQWPNPSKGRFNLKPFVNRHGIAISMEEQRRLPLRLEINPVKDTFSVNEPLEFDVVLTNVGKSNFFAKKLDFNMLQFILNNEPWGNPSTQKSKGGQRIMLQEGESLRARFKSQRFSKPGEVQIYVIYQLVVNGVNPFATAKVTIVP